MSKQVDQITLDIIRDSFQAIGEEMFITVARASKSPLIYEVLDYASGLTSVDAKLLTQGDGNAGFIGMLGTMVETVIEKFTNKGNLFEGDIILCNDPYIGGGSHLSDVGLVMPIFHNGKIVAYGVNKAHWTDIGGKNPGSWSTDATEVFQEGIGFPFIKIAEKGVLREDLIELIAFNVRTPDMSIGDMYAQIAGLKIGQRRVSELYEKFDAETIEAAIDKFLKGSSLMSQELVKEIPEGVYEVTQYIDSDGLSDEPIKIQVKVTIKDGRFMIDFTGTDPQVSGPINCPFSALISGMRIMFLSATDPHQNINDGVFEHLEVFAEKGSILNCERPAAVSIPWESMMTAMDAVQRAIAPVLPDKLLAASHCTVGAFIFEVLHPDTKQYNINVAPSLSGWGAGKDLDGQNAQFSLGNGETFNIPVEILEGQYGFFVDEYKLNTQTEMGAGAGEFRGGTGVSRKYRVLSDGSHYMGSFGRFKTKPWGLNDGHEGTNNFVQILRADGTQTERKGTLGRTKLYEGDVVWMSTSTGGGYGNPLKRPLEKVSMDAKNEFISIEEAREIYGVILDPESYEVVDTTQARKKLEEFS